MSPEHRFVVTKERRPGSGPPEDEEALARANTIPLPAHPRSPGPRRHSEVITREEREDAAYYFYATPAFLTGKSDLTTWLFYVNAVVGSGFLGIPYAFQRAGLGLSLGFLGAITLLAMATATYLIEAQDRLQALVNLTLLLARQEIHRALRQEGDPPADTSPRGSPLLPPLPGDFDIQSEDLVFEVNEISAFFLGPAGRRLWEVSILLEVYACLWLYCAMMGSTLLDVVPIPGLSRNCHSQAAALSAGCQTAYSLWLAAVAVVLIPITLRDLGDEGIVQIALAYTGHCILALMALTIGCALFVAPFPGVSAAAHPPYLVPQHLAVWSGFGLLFSTSVFTQMCHIAIPSLTQVMQVKRDIRTVVLAGMATTYVLYAILGTLTNLYFGPRVATIITLNWQDLAWTGSLGPLARAVNTLVVLMPFITIANAFPMNVHSLANNVITFVAPGTWKALLRLPDSTDPLLASAGPPLRVKLAARLLCAIPPFLLALVQRDPSRIVSIIGVFGFILMFLIPCALQVQSVRLFRRAWPHTKGIDRTRHGTPASSLWAVAIVFLLGAAGFVANFRTVLRSFAPAAP